MLLCTPFGAKIQGQQALRSPPPRLGFFIKFVCTFYARNGNFSSASWHSEPSFALGTTIKFMSFSLFPTCFCHLNCACITLIFLHSFVDVFGECSEIRIPHKHHHKHVKYRFYKSLRAKSAYQK